MSNIPHSHSYHFVRIFIADGEPKEVVRPVFKDGEHKIEVYTDARQEYAEFVCDGCGHKNTIATK